MRNIQYHLYLNETEDQKLTLLCGKTGLKRGVLLRKLILNKEIRERPNADFMTLERSFNRIGSNLNQLIYVANRTGMASNADLQAALQLMRQMKAEMESWKKQWL